MDISQVLLDDPDDHAGDGVMFISDSDAIRASILKTLCSVRSMADTGGLSQAKLTLICIN